MSKVEINKSVTNFSLPGTGGTEFSLSNFFVFSIYLIAALQKENNSLQIKDN